MGKWLAAGALALLVLVILLWVQMRSHDADPVGQARIAAPVVAVSAAGPATVKVQPAAVQAPAAEEELEAPQPSGKLDPRSDAFFNKFDEVVPRELTQNAAKCYERRHGSLHRNQKLSLMFKTKITHGVVTVEDVKIKESTLNDSALETCFIQEIQRSTWKDDELPDWEQDDQLVLRPERGMKKFWKEGNGD
jgi:hypothetical protein